MYITHILRRFLTVLLFIALTWSFQSTVYAEKVRHTNTKKHFLWSVESKQNTIYLLGSVHFLKNNSYPLPYEFDKAYNDAKTIVFESDLEGMNDPVFQDMMMKLARYAEGEKLSQNISKETYSLIKKRASSAGMSMEQLEGFKPWFVAMMLSVAEFHKLGFNPEAGIDQFFFNKAKRDDKSLVFLETNLSKIKLFAGLTKGRQERFLMQIMRELEVTKEMITGLVNAWETGNTDRLYEIQIVSFDKYPGLYDRIMIQRNKKWVPKIRKLMKQNDNVLIIVGAGHLVGKDSVIDLLKKSGYKVTQR